MPGGGVPPLLFVLTLRVRLKRAMRKRPATAWLLVAIAPALKCTDARLLELTANGSGLLRQKGGSVALNHSTWWALLSRCCFYTASREPPCAIQVLLCVLCVAAVSCAE